LVVVGTAIVGRAAGLADKSDTIGAGQISTPRCTSTAVTVVETITTTYVTGLTLSNIPSTCAGGTISVTMAEGAVSYTPASQTVPAGGGTVTVTIPSGDVPVTSTGEADVVIEGP